MAFSIGVGFFWRPEGLRYKRGNASHNVEETFRFPESGGINASATCGLVIQRCSGNLQVAIIWGGINVSTTALKKGAYFCKPLFDWLKSESFDGYFN